MYDINKREDLSGGTVEELLQVLEKLPRDAKLYCCGDIGFFVHVEKDESVVSIDMEDLEEDYANDEGTCVEDFWEAHGKLRFDLPKRKFVEEILAVFEKISKDNSDIEDLADALGDAYEKMIAGGK